MPRVHVRPVSSQPDVRARGARRSVLADEQVAPPGDSWLSRMGIRPAHSRKREHPPSTELVGEVDCKGCSTWERRA